MSTVTFIPITSPIQSTGDAFSVPNPLGVGLTSVQITMGAPGMIWLDGTLPFDDENIYLHTSDPTVAIQAFLTLNGTAGGLSAVSYFCQISDVVSEFPAFQRSAPGSVSDNQIQTWIYRSAARIMAALMQRGVDLTQPTLPNGQPVSFEQLNWLAELNEDAAASKLGAVLQSNVTLQPGEISIAGQRRRSFEAVMDDVRKGRYDAFWGLQSRLWGSVGGAETDRSTPGQRGENRAFGRNQEF